MSTNSADRSSVGHSLLREGGAPRSIVDQVTEAILEMVLDGVLAPGREVAIQDLSEQLAVSHVPVREALRRLETRGMIIFRRGRRPQIAPISVEDFDDVYRIRRLLEGDAAARSVPLFDDARLKIVEERWEEFRSAMLLDAPNSVPTLHANLHLALTPGATAWDRQILEQLWDASERYIRLFVSRATDRSAVNTIVGDHEAIVRAAGTTTPRQFKSIIVDHIGMSIDALRPMVVHITRAAQ